MSKFYAQYNLFGSETEVGCANMWQVASFDSRRARDAFVAQKAGRRDVAAITFAEAKKLAGRYQRYLHANGGHLAHTHLLQDGDRFIPAF